MLTQIKQWLEPPQFDGDEKKTSQTRVANTLIIYLGVALLVVILILIPLFAIQKIGSWILSLTVFCGLVVGRHLIFKGNFRLGAVLIFSIIYLCILALLILSGGSSSTAMFYFATVVLIAGFFLDARVVNGLTISTFLIAMGISFLQESGLLSIPKVFVFNSVFSWIATGLGLLFMIYTRDLFVGNLENTLALARQQNTALQQVESALRESEARYRELFDAEPDGVILVGSDERIERANIAQARMYGYDSPNDLIGIHAAQLVALSSRDYATQTMRRRLNGEDIPPIEYELVRKDGTTFYGEISATILKNPDGIVQSYVCVTRDITERKNHENELRAIATLSAALRTAETRAEMLPVMVEQMAALLNCDSASIEIIDPVTGDAIVEEAHGAWQPLIGSRQADGTGMNAIISKTRLPYHTNDLENDTNLVYPEWAAKTGIRAGAGVPLIAQEKLIGFVWMGRKTDIAQSEVSLLASIADIAANALYRATLHEQTQKDATDLALAYDTTLEGWAHALELRDHETEGHTRRVVQLTVDLARAMGIKENELECIRRGALLHDIGKMGIPDSILLKQGALDEHEWEIMRQHPGYAYKLLEPIEYLRPVLDIPYFHHEKWDGTGYPHSLKGEDIPLAARIFAIVDVWDALTSDRPYRPAWLREKALSHIAEQSNKHFDPAVVDAFLNVI